MCFRSIAGAFWGEVILCRRPQCGMEGAERRNRSTADTRVKQRVHSEKAAGGIRATVS